MGARAQRHRFTVTMADNATESTEFQCDSGSVVGIIMPAAGFVAGNIQFQAKVGTSTWATIVDKAGTEVAAVTPLDGEYVALDPALLTGIGTARLKSTVSQTGGPLTFGVIVVTTE